VAALLSILTGISRVYVGVHDPTAVIGGWIAGLLWAFVCWLAARQFEGTTHIRAERTKSA
jgi:undecaprenyl-diphosphatase